MDLHVSYLTFLLATAWLTRNVKGLPPGATCVSGQNKDIPQLLTEYLSAGYTIARIVEFLLRYHGVTLSLNSLAHKSYKVYNLRIVFNVKPWHLDILHEPIQPRQNVSLCRLRSSQDSQAVESIRQVKYMLKCMKVGRRRATCQTPLHVVEAKLKELLETSASSLGYRAMWCKLKKTHHMNVKRDDVALLLRQLDPVGVSIRRRKRFKRGLYTSKGPNDTWHVDGYDKLKDFGFFISGCIDGFSRQIVWLECGSTNKDPKVIAGYFLDAIRSRKGCPELLRTDPGTENSTIATLQMVFRRNGSDSRAGIESHRYGKSTSNQRIECFWSKLLRQFTCWWRDFFIEMIENGEFSRGHIIQIGCLQYCFSDIIRHELADLASEHNDHRIRKSVYNSPHGTPNELYYLPGDFGGTNCLKNVSTSELVWAEQHVSGNRFLGSQELEEFLDMVMNRKGWRMPATPVEAKHLYNKLVDIALNGD